jgi:hypothetical protein
VPSPDITPYVDLTLYDRQPVDVYEDAVEYARTSLPEWTPVPGSVEDAVLQAAAQMSGEVIGAINRVPSAVVEALLKLFGIDRIVGTFATGSLTITAIDAAGYTISAGTRFAWLETDPLTGESVLYPFETVNDLVITPGNTSGAVDIQAATVGLRSALGTGANLRLISAVAFISSAVLASPLQRGSDQETDAEYFARAIATLNSYTQTLVTADQITQYILSNYSVAYRCKAYSRLNPANLSYDPTLANLADGYLTIYTSGPGGLALGATVKNTIRADIESRAVAGLDVSVRDPVIVPVTVTATVTAKAGFAQNDVQDAVEAALAGYLHPNHWDWSPFIYYNEVVSLIDQAAGVDRVASLTIAVPSGATAVSSDWRFSVYGSLPEVTPAITVTT